MKIIPKKNKNKKPTAPKDMFPSIKNPPNIKNPGWGDRRPITVREGKLSVKKTKKKRKPQSNGSRPKHEPRMTK